MLIAVGDVSKIAVFHLQLFVIVVPVIIFIAYYGLEAIAYAIMVISSAVMALAYYFVSRTTRLEWSNIGRSIAQSIGVLFCSIVGLATVMASVGKEESILFIMLLAGALTAFVGWVFGIFVVKRPIRQHLQEVLVMARGYLKRT